MSGARHAGHVAVARHSDDAVPGARQRRRGARLHYRQARTTARRRRRQKNRNRRQTADAADEPIATALKIDDLKVELGYALLPLVNAPDGTDRLTEQIKALRRSLAVEMGFVMPAVRILDNVQLDANCLRDQDQGSRGRQRQGLAGHYMVMDPAGGQVKLPGTHTTEPTFGSAGNVGRRHRSRKKRRCKGYTVVDAATVLSTHLTELLKSNMAELLSYGEVQKLLKELPKEQADLVKDLVPTLITISGIQRVLQILLAERVSIRDLVDHSRRHRRWHCRSRNPVTLAEHVRARIVAPDLRAVHQPERLSAADRAVGEMGTGFRRIHCRTGRRSPTGDAALAPVRIHRAGPRTLRGGRARRRSAGAGHFGGIRPFVRGIVERFRAQTPVLSQGEIHPRARLKTVGSI